MEACVAVVRLIQCQHPAEESSPDHRVPIL